MAGRVLDVAWEACLLEPRRDRELEAYSRRETGVVSDGVPYLASRPWLARAHIRWNYSLLNHLDLTLAEQISLVVSQENSCRYCYAASRALLRVQGLSEKRIQALEQRLAGDGPDPRTAAALGFARRMARAAAVDPGARKELLAAGWSVPEANEIAACVAATVFNNRLASIIAMPTQPVEALAESKMMWLMAPVLRVYMERYRRRSRPVSPEPSPDLPYACVTQAFAGTRLAGLIADVMRELEASDVLPVRARALMFAVIGHGLGCDLSTSEARRMLRGAEMDEAEFDEVLAHLGSPRLDPLENDLAAFARETIWYVPVQLQRRARALRDRLSTEQFVEAVGIASLANALCRLAAAVADRP
jgi:AhpD family alkylhydroperoxidase